MDVLLEVCFIRLNGFVHSVSILIVMDVLLEVRHDVLH